MRRGLALMLGAMALLTTDAGANQRSDCDSSGCTIVSGATVINCRERVDYGYNSSTNRRACTVTSNGNTVGCALTTRFEPPYAYREQVCVAGAIAAGCMNTSWPSYMGPADGGDCVVDLGARSCRFHTAEDVPVWDGTMSCRWDRPDPGRKKRRRARR